MGGVLPYKTVILWLYAPACELAGGNCLLLAPSHWGTMEEGGREGGTVSHVLHLYLDSPQRSEHFQYVCTCITLSVMYCLTQYCHYI